jgi:hypothetical protein
MNNGINISTTDKYPIFDPNIHLNDNDKINNNNNNKDITYNFNLKNLNILSNECKSYLEPLSTQYCFPIFTIECINIIKWELNNWLLNKDKCDNLKKFENNKIFYLNFESPKLINCFDILPFLYSAFTHPKTLDLISNQIGFKLNIILDYEIAHFAKKIDSNLNKKLNNLNSNLNLNFGEYSKIIIREKSVAYPYICIINLNSIDISNNLPLGYGFFLKGRLIENLAGKIIFNKNSNSEMILCPSFVPSKISNYEDLKDRDRFKDQIKKQSFKKIKLSSSSSSSSSSYSSSNVSLKPNHHDSKIDKDVERIKKYKNWLNSFYLSENHMGDLQKQ